MRIGVVGPFNPACVGEYLDCMDAPEFNINASSVNIYIRSLLKLGHSVIVFTCDPNTDETYILCGKVIKVYCITRKFKLKGFGRYRIYHRIRNCIKDEINDLNILHAEWTYEYALAVMPFVKIKPTFCSVRDWCPYLLSMARGFKEKYYWWMSYCMFKKVMKCKYMHFIANSEYTQRQIQRDYPHYNVPIIPNPIDSKFIQNKRKTYPKNKRFVSISFALHEGRKNYVTLLKGFQKYFERNPNSELLLIGTYDKAWKNEMEAQGLLKGVYLLGMMSHDEIYRVLDRSSCLVHPSFEETFGNVLLEAMCRRVPCIGGEKSGAVPQVLEYGTCGILCDVTKPEAICEAMEMINEGETIERIVDEGTKRLFQNYSDEKVAQMHITYFENINGI